MLCRGKTQACGELEGRGVGWEVMSVSYCSPSDLLNIQVRSFHAAEVYNEGFVRFGWYGNRSGVSLIFWAREFFGEKAATKEGESDKAKEGKLLDSLMRALLPVWESLVMLGPDQGERVKGREGGRERWDKRGTQENWQGCRRHRKCQPPPLFFFSVRHRGDGSQVFKRHQRRRWRWLGQRLPHVLFWESGGL